MTTDYVEDEVSVAEPEPPATRWEARALDLGPIADRPERGGIVLAAFIALLLPLIIAGAVLLPGSDSLDSDSDGNVLESTGLDGITISPSLGDDAPATSTAEDDGDAIETEVGGTIEVDTADAGDQDETVEGDVGTEPEGAGAADDSGASDPTPTTPTTSPSTAASVSPTTATTEVTASTEPPTTSTPATTEPPTSAPSSTTEVPVTTTVAPTTTVPVTTLPPDDDPDPPAFIGRVEIGQIGETFVRYYFTAESTTAYAAVVRDENGIVATTTGTAVGGEEVSKSANGLTPGTDYTVRVRLLGPPESASTAVPFRTSGGSPPPAEEPVEIENLRIVSVTSTQATVNYETNICANGSFVVREVGGDVVGRNGGQADGCTTRHLAVPGFWTPPLEPDTSYVLEVTVEADGQGRGDGNEATEIILFTTEG